MWKIKVNNMKNELVVKDTALINASYNLSLVEQRIILLAIVIIREHTHKNELDYIFLNKPISISAISYMNTFKVSPSTAYESLKDACKTLFSRQFSYQEPREKGLANVTSRWVQKIAYIDNFATIEISFANDVFPLITHLEKHLTSYELKQVASLTSSYAIRLYELLIAWRSIGKTPEIQLIDFRRRMGVDENEYQRMELFKRRVLNPSIEQINLHTDITVEYVQHKAGRTITGFSFNFTQKKIVKSDVIEHVATQDTFIKLSEAQLDMFSSKLADLGEIQNMAHTGEEMKPFIARLRTMLMDEQDQQKLRPYLAQIGFVTR